MFGFFGFRYTGLLDIIDHKLDLSTWSMILHATPLPPIYCQFFFYFTYEMKTCLSSGESLSVTHFDRLALRDDASM